MKPFDRLRIGKLILNVEIFAFPIRWTLQITRLLLEERLNFSILVLVNSIVGL